jgi:hypothetical protein
VGWSWRSVLQATWRSLRRWAGSIDLQYPHVAACNPQHNRAFGPQFSGCDKRHGTLARFGPG